MRRLPIRHSLLCVALSSLAFAAQAKEIRCEIHSDYDMTVNERSVIFTRETGTPKAIVMRQGRLFVDDRWVTLSKEDSERLKDFEQGARKAMPLAHEIGRDAADIAFTALGEVAAGISNHPDKTRRYGAALVYAAGYVVLALFTAPIVNLFATLPADTVAAIAGVALLLPLANALGGIFAEPGPREPALITFAATASGFALFGVGSAFWGLIAGFLALGAQRLLSRRSPHPSA